MQPRKMLSIPKSLSDCKLAAVKMVKSSGGKMWMERMLENLTGGTRGKTLLRTTNQFFFHSVCLATSPNHGCHYHWVEPPPGGGWNCSSSCFYNGCGLSTLFTWLGLNSPNFGHLDTSTINRGSNGSQMSITRPICTSASSGPL